MQITKVELKNIKNHAEAEWSFQPGVIAICGPNGAGKTTILEAIAWALFDHLEYKRDDFVKRGTKRGSVTVGFLSDKDGREYIVQRDTGGGYHVYDPDTKQRIVEQKNQVVYWLQQHIGVEPGTDLSALFKTTIGVPQGTFTYDFTLTPGQRKSIFDQILKVEEYRQASDNLRDTLRHLEARLAEADRKLAEAEGELKSYDETKRRHDETAARLDTLERGYAAAQIARDRAAQESERLEQLRQQLEMQRGMLERLNTKQEVTRGSLASAQEAAEGARAAAALVAAARAGYENHAAAVQRLAELEPQRALRDELRARAANAERQLIEARSQVKSQQERLAEAAAARAELVQLATQVDEQTVLETRLAELREGRGELQSLRRSTATLNADLENLRKRYTALSKQIETAEAQRTQAARVAELENERTQLNQAIAQQEAVLNNAKLTREHLETLRKEQARLTAELARNERERQRLEPLADVAVQLAKSEAEQQRQTEQLAHLRAEVKRDEEMITSLASGGICPLLTEKCLNLKPGESLESRFRTGLEMRRGEIKNLQSGLQKLAAEVKQARAAATETAQLPRLRTEAERLANELVARNQQLQKSESEAARSSVAEAELKSSKEKRAAIEEQLRKAREAERLYAQAEVLRRELAEVGEQGKSKKNERAELDQRLATLANVEAEFVATEKNLQALSDPRSRALALKRVLAREAEWRRASETAEQQASESTAALEQLQVALQGYATLEAEITAATAARVASERDHQIFIANENIAATVDARAAEAAAMASAMAQIETARAAAQAGLQELNAQYEPTSYARAQEELNQWRECATQLATQLEHTREQFARLQEQLAQLEAVRAVMRAQLAVKEKTLQLRETADFIRDILQKAVPFITEAYLHSISSEANQLFREITGRYDVTLKWAKDYEVTLEEEGRERPFANLSGGEQMAAALAVRLALLKELSEVNLAFFDEPTANMDEERRRNLAQQIGRIKDFQQLFVISHDDTFEGYTDQTISLGERAG